jgi:hypothetical protein
MSKDKGTKNHKKPKADKSKGKAQSAYQSESKSGKDKHTNLEPFVPKTAKGDGKSKND